MAELLRPSLDFVFKGIFGTEENKDEVLLNFINEAVRETESKPFTSLTLVNTHIDKDMIDDKRSILDVRAKNEDGKQVNVEIQVKSKKNMAKRTLYYWSKLYEEQLGESKPYTDLKKTITMNIMVSRLLPNERLHNVFHLREDHTGEVLVDDIEIHFFELSKLTKAHRMDDPLVRWLTFIKGVSQEMWEELAMGTPGLKKAMTTLEFLSQDKKMRALARAREKALRDEISELDSARKEGIAEGEQKGRAEGKEIGKLEVAKNLLSKDMSVSEVSEVTGLLESEIAKLKEQKNETTNKESD
jgi:predicted transposase/invertase (TIGR01784 family)